MQKRFINNFYYQIKKIIFYPKEKLRTFIFDKKRLVINFSQKKISEQNNLNTARSTPAASGSGTAGLYFGGSIPGSPDRSAATEEWNVPSSTIKVLTD